MRRSDKAIQERAVIDEIIRGSLVCHLALADGNEPYLVPLSFGYDGEALFFHTAREGRKIDIWLRNSHVAFGFERNVGIREDPDTACRWTMTYESVNGRGTVFEVTDPGAMRRALNEIMRQYSGRTWDFQSVGLDRIRVWRIAIASLTGKRSPAKP